MSVGHEPQKRVCNTMRPATELITGIVVGHFGDGGRRATGADEREGDGELPDKCRVGFLTFDVVAPEQAEVYALGDGIGR